jgi:hypothetical protein
MGIGTEDWKQLAEAIKGVNQHNRKIVSDAAGIHSLHHHNNRRLQQLWKEISNAFA